MGHPQIAAFARLANGGAKPKSDCRTEYAVHPYEPNLLLRDGRGIALDTKNKDVIVSDKTLNAVLRFHVPEAF